MKRRIREENGEGVVRTSLMSSPEWKAVLDGERESIKRLDRQFSLRPVPFSALFGGGPFYAIQRAQPQDADSWEPWAAGRLRKEHLPLLTLDSFGKIMFEG